MLRESVEALVQNPDGTYVDITYGGGGHSQAILERLSAKGKLIAFDRDSDAVENRVADKRLMLVHHNYRFLKNFLQFHKATPIDGLLGDLGISSHQINEADRGFAHRLDADLDMRMDRKSKHSAAHVINNYTEQKLADVFFQYGEVSNSRKLAASIVSARRMGNIVRTAELNQVIAPLVPQKIQSKYLSQVYQALRIEVNGELLALKKMLMACNTVIRPGGRMVIISYHSLEDRLVKNFINSGNFSGEKQTDMYGNIQRSFRPEPNKALVPSDAETTANNRARSAKMRVAIKL